LFYPTNSSAPPDEEILDGTIEGLTPSQQADFLEGDELFGKNYTIAEGLGPIYVQTACAKCHRADGKAHPENAFFVVPETALEGPQLQQKAIPGYEPETPSGLVSKRVAPIVTGLGFLDGIPESTLFAWADAADSDLNGISGRISWVKQKTAATNTLGDSVLINDSLVLGRFGYKAKMSSLRSQVVFALKQDIGITSDFDTEDIYNPRAGFNTGDKIPDPEVPASVVNNLVIYLRTLKVPPRRNEQDPEVLKGEVLFNSIGCTNCHKPSITTGPSDIEALSFKTIHPYTDLLLHDMGPRLDDGVTEEGAQSFEWRTTPLWGIGLAEEMQGGKGYYLHNGAANTLAEAIDFHGGEALNAKNNFADSLTGDQKSQLIAFLKSL